MSQPEPTFIVVFKQLGPDAKSAGLELGETERPDVSGRELRTLLRNAGSLAPRVTFPLAPELRITAASGRYVVQLKDGRLHFVSWSSAKSRGGNPTADQIFEIITGAAAPEEKAPAATAPAGRPATSGGSSGSWRWVVGILLGLAFVGINFYTIWNYRKPPGKLLPPFRLLDEGPDKRLLESVAGQYETGGAAGDRRLEVSRDGKVIWIKFGLNRLTAEKREFTAQGAESEGQPALFTSRSSLIKVKDQATLVLFGDTYLRVLR